VIIGSRDNNGKFLDSDFITPHKDEFKDPIPLQFLKVLPGVTFCFQFILRDGKLEKGKKLDLFKRILLDLGIGAKTNVGYGKFEKEE
jgi:CRISPR-associated protein Cmr6